MDILIIDRTTMKTGGIEVYFSNLMRYAISTKRRVIWLTTEGHESKSSFSITELDSVEKIYITRTPFGPEYPPINTSKNDNIIMLTTDPCRYVISDGYRTTLSYKSYLHLLILPHFSGAGYYPESIFRSVSLKRIWHKKMGKLALDLVSADCVRGFAQKHLEVYERSYNLHIANIASKTLPPISIPAPIEEEEELLSKARSRSGQFEIISCSRFDFPHKGYLLGLIKAFGKIHDDFPFAKLTIVGYGPGQCEVEKEIKNLSLEAAGCIELTGELSPEELTNRYYRAHLNVGVAGALAKGALCALPSINMKHYTYECEGFGFIEDAKGLDPNSKSFDMTGMIESVITMPEDEYVRHSVAAYRAVADQMTPDPEYLFRQKRTSMSGCLSMSVCEARMLFFMRLFAQKILGRGMFE